MAFMKKIAPIALALGLTARALLGNPLETTIIKEDNKNEMIDFTGNAGNESFSLDASLPMGNNWEWDFSSDMQFNGTPRVNHVDTVIGNDRFFAGFSYGDLSSETILQDANILKVQTGLRPLDWLDFSLTGAIVNMPNMTEYVSSLDWGNFQTPFTLYAAGLNVNIGEKFDLKSFSLFPWLSLVASGYYANPQNTTDFQTANADFPGYNSFSLAFPFDHLRVEGGLDFDTKYIDLVYKGTLENVPFITPSNFTNMIGMIMHDEGKKKFNLEYDVSLITKPQFSFDQILSPTRNELQFDINGFYLFDNGFYVKADVSALIDFLTPNQFNVVAAIGKKTNSGNFELYYSLQNDAYGNQNSVFGLQYSTQLDRSMKNENKARDEFHNSAVSNPNIPSSNVYLGYPSSPMLTALHTTFGNTLEEAVSNVHSEQDLSKLIGMISMQEHDGTYSAREEYEQIGSGVCRDTNGNLAPYIESKALNYKNVYAVGLRGPFIAHVIVLLETKDGKYDLRNYADFYELNAPTPQAAVDKVFPGAYIFDDGTVSTAVSTIRDAVERPLYDWTKFRKD
jgi:hypothetical protein